MLDIVGARFHCAICDAVDICSNCESAGLPGNLTSDDGGHDSSHIMIKVQLLLYFRLLQVPIFSKDSIPARDSPSSNGEQESRPSVD
jgi:hypothetical protein